MSSRPAQLWLVGRQEQPEPEDEARQVFEHWCYMMEKNANRCAFGPARRQRVNAMLALYGSPEMLLLAIEGCAADAYANGANNLGRTFNDLVDIFADEARLERYAEAGEALRLRAQRRLAAQQASAQEPAEPVDPAKVLADKERLRAWLKAMRGRV